MIEPYLEDLESRLDPEVEEDLLSQWGLFLDGRVGSGLFTPRRRRVAPPTLDWPKIRVNEALDNPELMILQQLAGCSATLASGSGGILNIRPNYGTGILPTIYGAEVFRMDDDLDTLPTNWPIPGGAEAIARRLDRGAPDLDAGYGRACFTTGKLMADLLRNYPKLSRYVFIYHPDLQGPMDGVYAVNMSQPEYNDMERIFQNTVDRGIALIGFQRQAAEAALGRGRDLQGLVQVF